jgi:hypothetical protein
MVVLQGSPRRSFCHPRQVPRRRRCGLPLRQGRDGSNPVYRGSRDVTRKEQLDGYVPYCWYEETGAYCLHAWYVSKILVTPVQILTT